MEPSCTVGGNVNWYSCCGEQYGSPLKKLNIELPYDSAVHEQKAWEKQNLKGHMYPNIYCSTIYNISYLLKVMSTESLMPSHHFILCHPLSSCLQSFPASGSFPMSWLFSSSGQSIGVSASASVLPMNIQEEIGGVCIHTAGSLHCIAESNTTLSSNYIPIKKLSKTQNNSTSILRKGTKQS